MNDLVAAWCWIVSALISHQQTFRVDVELVRVDVLVTDGKRPVEGLTVADFELRDSGILQRVNSVHVEDVPLNIMLALDVSGSVAGQPLEHLKQAASDVAALLRTGDRGALVTFAEEVDLTCEWTADRQQLLRAIAGTAVSGSTALHDATYAALAQRQPQAGRTLVLVFSDGEDNASWLTGSTVLDFARRSEAVVYGVGVRTGAAATLGYLADFRSGTQPAVPNVVPSILAKSFLAAISEETGGKYLDVERTDRLREAFLQVVTEFRSRYLLTYTPSGIDSAGWHPIEIKLKGRKGTVIARRGYTR